MPELLTWARWARLPHLALIAIPLMLSPSAVGALDEDTKDTVNVLSDLMARGCGLGQSIAISGEASALGILGFRIPGVGGEIDIEGTYEEIPTLLKDLVPDSGQATETRDCMKGFMQQIFNAILADTLQSDTTKKEIKLAHLNRVFAGGETSRMTIAVDSALESNDRDFKQAALRLALGSKNRELQSRAIGYVLSQVKVLGGVAKYRSKNQTYENPFQIELKDFRLETGSFSGKFSGPFLKGEQNYGQGRLSGTELTLVNDFCALHVQLQEPYRMVGIMTCTRIYFYRYSYSRVQQQVSLVIF